jgi:hypothetical protein
LSLGLSLIVKDVRCGDLINYLSSSLDKSCGEVVLVVACITYLDSDYARSFREAIIELEVWLKWQSTCSASVEP